MSIIPFESIRFPQTDEPLISKMSILYNYSTPIWYANRSQKKEDVDLKILSIAPVFNQNNQTDNDLLVSAYRGGFNLSPLTYSLNELAGIKNLCKENQVGYYELTKEKSSEKILKTVINKYNVLHFATHGLTNMENHERSGIFLYPDKNKCDSCLEEDNFLSLGEIYNLNLKAELAVLSACNSGSGKIAEGEGIMALPKGFLYAGVPNIIASLWIVHDERTKELMVAFYRHLLEDKVNYAEALRRAKLDCIEKGFLPVDWSGFVLIGN
jgi:CHAT domain-containing protein